MAVYATVVTTLASTKSLNASLVLIIPCAIYFSGLVLAYVTHTINFTMDGDIEQKERLSDAMEFIITNEEQASPVPGLKEQLEALALFVSAEREKLLTLPKIQKMQIAAAYCYALSMLSFLASTLLILTYFSLYLANTGK